MSGPGASLARFFLRLDPVLVLGVDVAARALAASLWLAGVVVLAGLLFGRRLCGTSCPTGAALDAAGGDTLRAIAGALGKDVDDLVVFVLDKPRHKELITEIRKAGARIQLHTDGDVAGSLMAVDPTNVVDVMMGTGGTPEGVLSACAIRAVGGRMLARLDPQKDDEKKALAEAGTDTKSILTEETLVRSDDTYFAATGISGGTFLRGVRFTGRGAVTHSLVLRGKTGTMRRIESHIALEKLMRFSAVKYD